MAQFSVRGACGFVLVDCTSSCAVNTLPRFDTKSFVYRYSQTLPAVNMAFSSLHRDMPEEKLDLFKLALPNHGKATPTQSAQAATGGPRLWPRVVR